MTLEERLDADLKDAIRRGEDTRKLAIRSVKAALAEERVAGEQARELTEEEAMSILFRQVKQRRDSIAEYVKGNRPDLAAQEEAELAVLQVYMPAQLDEAAVRERAQAVIADLQVTDMKGFGPVMKRLSSELRGQADGQLVNRVVRELLSGTANK